jgi:hypothetical protein
MNAAIILCSDFAALGFNIHCPAMPEKTHRDDARQQKPA